jgi:hypothetical protein
MGQTGQTCSGAADFVDKILRGVKPGNIPVEQSTKLLKDIAPVHARWLPIQPPRRQLGADHIINAQIAAPHLWAIHIGCPKNDTCHHLALGYRICG